MFHPGAMILAWSAALVGLQALAGIPLAMTALALLIFGGAGRRWWVLVRRSRWLIVVLLLTFAFGTPGESVIPGFPLTGDGLVEGAVQVLRLLALLGSVAMLLDTLVTEQLIAGLLALASPFDRLGADSRRAAARLMLVLEHVQGDRFADWRAALRGEESSAPRRIQFDTPSWHTSDFWLLSGAVLILLGVALA